MPVLGPHRRAVPMESGALEWSLANRSLTSPPGDSETSSLRPGALGKSPYPSGLIFLAPANGKNSTLQFTPLTYQDHIR